MQRSCCILVVLVWIARHVVAYTITGDTIQTLYLNGIAQQFRTVTVQFNEGDAGHSFVLSTLDEHSGETHSIEFTNKDPVYSYFRNLVGWVPRSVVTYENRIIFGDNVMANASAFESPSGDKSDIGEDGTNAVLRHKQHRSVPQTERLLPKRYRKNMIYKYNETRAELMRSEQQRELGDILRSNRFHAVGYAKDPTPQAWKKVFHAVATPLQGDPVGDYNSGNSHSTSVGGVLKGALCQFTDQILSAFGNDWCGGSGTKDAIITLQNEILQQQNEFASIGDALSAQQAWQTQTQQTNDWLLGMDKTLESQVNRANRDIAIQQRDIDILRMVTYQFMERVTTDLQEVNSKITALAENQAILLNMTRAVINATELQLHKIISRLSDSETRIMLLAMDMFHLERKTLERRALNAQMWQSMVNAPTDLPMCVFSRCIGSSPMPVTGDYTTFKLEQAAGTAHCPATPDSCSYLKKQVNPFNTLLQSGFPDPPTSTSKLQTLYSAGVLSTVRFKYSTSTKAIDRVVSLVCDKVWAVDNVIPNVDFQFIFRSIGPPKDSNNTYCYGDNPSLDTWQCHCVVVQTFSFCTLKTEPEAPMFPYGWTEVRSLKDSEEISTYCTGGLQTSETVVSESVGTAVAIASKGTVYSDTDSWNDFLRDFCESSSTWRQHNDGRKLRMSSDTDPGNYTDLKLFTGNVSGICDPDYTAFPDATAAERNQRLSYLLYYAWQRGYQTMQSVMIAFWEEQLYGTKLTEEHTDDRVFNYRSDVQQAGREFTQTFLKYAGEGYRMDNYSDTLFQHGFDNDPGHLNPEADITDNTYPPLPHFLIDEDAIGNPIKLPVYSIAPAAIIHDPVLTIDGGTCTLVNGKCTTPINGKNFSSALEMTLNAQWDQLRPGARFIVGDYPSASSFVIDAPFDMLPQGYSRKSVCGTLFYLWQPRNSPHSTNPDFNIPDVDWTTGISAAEWLRVFDTEFDPRCASEYAMRYARRVDADGICQERVLDTGASDVVKPGHKDICTLMDQFKIAVPNYVHAFMELIPRKYTFTATFQIPAGLLVQNVSTSCPTSYDVALAGDGQYRNIKFYTTATSNQRARYEVQSYNPECASTRQDFTYSATVPFTPSAFLFCGKQYVNVYPYLSNDPCYPAPGIEIWKAHSSDSGPIVPDTVQQYVSQQQDQIAVSLADIMVKSMIAQYELSRIPLIAKDEDEVVQMYQEQIQKHLDDINSVDTSFNDSSEATAKQQYQQQLMNDSSQVLQDMIAAEQDQKSFVNQSAYAIASNVAAEQLNKASIQQLNVTWTLINQTRDEILEEMKRVLADVGGDSGGDSNCDWDWIPLLGTMICALSNMFSSIERIIVFVIMIGIIACLIGCCVKTGCCGAMCKAVKSTFTSKSHDNDTDEDDTSTKKHRSSNKTDGRFHDRFGQRNAGMEMDTRGGGTAHADEFSEDSMEEILSVHSDVQPMTLVALDGKT